MEKKPEVFYYRGFNIFGAIYSALLFLDFFHRSETGLLWILLYFNCGHLLS